jgi:hypothetical protein
MVTAMTLASMVEPRLAPISPSRLEFSGKCLLSQVVLKYELDSYSKNLRHSRILINDGVSPLHLALSLLG